VSYYFQAEIARPCAAVTAACLLTRRPLFLELGGFDEKHYAVSMNDVDYCMRLAQRGLRVVYVGSVELFHDQSQTRSRRDDPAELAHFKDVYRNARDIHYNPNLSNVHSYELDSGCHLDYEVYLDRPVRALMVTHNLNLEGATKSLYELAAGLNTGGRVRPTILSPVGGIGEQWYRDAGVDVRIQDLPNCRNILEGWPSKADYEASIERVLGVIEEERPDVAIANTLNGFYVVDAATRAGIPSIWIIRESYSREQMRRSINTFVLSNCEHAFADAYQVVFVSADTMRLYERYHRRHNFLVVHNGLDARRIDEFIGQVGKAEAVRTIRAPAGKKIVTTVGTICERKEQCTLAEAVAILRRQRDDFCCYIVGLREGIPYVEKLRRIIRDNHLEEMVKLIPETDEVRPYLRAADIFAFTSRIEAFSRTVLEAEAFGLPIVTTPCYGIHEQVRAEVNGLMFDMSDAPALARHLATLLDDDQKRIWMGRNSRKVFDYLRTYDEMVERYERLIFGAWMRGPLEG
ncbi:MAG: glycosyltransferase, partial [Candidatus Methylomirabilis sp.]